MTLSEAYQLLPPEEKSECAQCYDPTDSVNEDGLCRYCALDKKLRDMEDENYGT